MSDVITVREALRDAMAEELRADKDVLVLGEEVAEYQGAYKVTEGLLAEFGSKRIVDTPITEHGFAGLAVGVAMSGLRPVLEFMTFNFAMQAIDQIINSASKTHYMSGGEITCPIVFRGPNGASLGVAAQHSQCFASWYSHCPGLKVVSPYLASDYKALLKSAIKDNSPVVFLESELLYSNTQKVESDFEEPVEIGKARTLRPGTDCTIVSYSYVLNFALEAAELLQLEHGINCEIIDLRTLRPLDEQAILKSVMKTGHLITIDEGWGFANIGSEICALVGEKVFDYLDAPFARISAEDVPLPYSKILEKECLPTTEKIIKKVLGLFDSSIKA